MVYFRTAPLKGYVTDSSGNVLKNTLVNVKEEHTDGFLAEVDSLKTDDNGYFVTKPLRRGVYDVFESGIKLAKLIHNPSTNLEIPAYPPELDAAPAPIISDPFDQEILDAAFLQIEPYERNVDDYGHIFDIIPLAYTGFADTFPAAYFTGADEYLTADRFDVFYNDQFGRKVMWRGVPGFVYNKDANNNTRLVVPIDNYSLVPKFLKTQITRNIFTTNRWLYYEAAGGGYMSYSPLVTGGVIDAVSYVAGIDDIFYDAFNLGDIMLFTEAAPAQTLYLKLVKKTKTVNALGQATIDMRFIDWEGRPTALNRQGIHYKQATDTIDSVGGFIVLQGAITELIYSYYGMGQAMNPTQNITPQTFRNRFIVLESRFATQYARHNTSIPDPVLDLPHENELYSYP